MKTFTHNKVKYTVHPLTVYQVELVSMIAIDILSALGFSHEDAPRTLQAQVLYYARLIQATDCDSDLFSTGEFVDVDHTENYKKWLEVFNADRDLQTKWAQAFREANAQDNDPLS